MKQHITAYIFTACITGGILLLAGCTKRDFGDVNTNPYITSTPVTQNLLTGALRSLPGVTNDATGARYAQYVSDVQYTDGSRFLTFSFDYASYYRGPLLNLQKIIDINKNPATAAGALTNGSNANQIAVARILKAFYLFPYHKPLG